MEGTEEERDGDEEDGERMTGERNTERGRQRDGEYTFFSSSHWMIDTARTHGDC